MSIVWIRQVQSIFDEHARVVDDAAYARYYVPGAGRVLWQAAVADLHPRTPFRVDYRRIDRAPLLFVAGGADHVAPPSVNRANARCYRKSPAVADYHEFPDRDHFTLGAPGWEQVADYALDWAEQHAQTRYRAAEVTAPSTAGAAAAPPPG